MNSLCQSDFKTVACKFRRRQCLNSSRRYTVLLCVSCQRTGSWGEINNQMKGALGDLPRKFWKIWLHLGVILAHSWLWSPSTWMNISLIWQKKVGGTSELRSWWSRCAPVTSRQPCNTALIVIKIDPNPPPPPTWPRTDWKKTEKKKTKKKHKREKRIK